jgi:hypothetical protein
MHEERRAYEAIRIMVQHAAERPGEFNHVCGSHADWRGFCIFVDSPERSVDDGAGVAHRCVLASDEFVA